MPRNSYGLLTLQGNIKRDPEGNHAEFEQQYRHYKACLNLHQIQPGQQSREFAELVMFVAQVAHCYPNETETIPLELMDLLSKSFSVLQPPVRLVLVKALILMHNRGRLTSLQVTPFFLKLLRYHDKTVRQLVFQHILAEIKGANHKHRNDQLNRALQNLMFATLGEANEMASKKALGLLTELWRRQIWRDARTANVIAGALLHSSTPVAVRATKFFLGQDDLEEDEDADEDEGGLDVATPSKADVYKANNKGTAASKKKKKAKLARVVSTLKRRARQGKAQQQHSFAALQLIHDPQDLAEKLFARVHKSGGERFEMRLGMMQVLSRMIGCHQLMLLNFYPFLQKYIQPHQAEVPTILAILVQACHDLVPPDALEPVLRQLVDTFVHDRAQPEVMTLGLRTVRELCSRCPLIMTPALLQDLAEYSKFREKAAASAARSLVSLFRDIAPGMLEKKDRGRGADLGAVPLAYGQAKAVDRIPGVHLLEAEERERLAKGDGSSDEGSDDDGELQLASDADLGSDQDEQGSEGDSQEGADDGREAGHQPAQDGGDAAAVSASAGSSGRNLEEPQASEDDGADSVEALSEHSSLADEPDSQASASGSEAEPSLSEAASSLESSADNEAEDQAELRPRSQDAGASGIAADGHSTESQGGAAPQRGQAAKRERGTDRLLIERRPRKQRRRDRRKAMVNAEQGPEGLQQDPESDSSLAALKAQLASQMEAKRRQEADAAAAAAGALLEQQRILTPEDFERIRELRQQELVDAAMAKHGLRSAAKRDKLLAAAQDDADAALDAADRRGMQGERRVDPSTLQGVHKKRKDKEERLAAVRAGREGNAYGAAAGLKKQKTGGTSNRQKSKSKNLPKAAFKSAQNHRRQHTARHNVSTNFKGRRARTRR